MTKTPTVQDAARVRSSQPVATASTVNIKSVQVGVAPSETQLTYASEDAFELEMPTRTLSLDEANDWLAMIAEAEGVIRKAHESIEQDRRKMEADVKTAMVGLVAATTAKVTGKVLTADDQKRLNDETIKEIAA